VPLSAVSLLAHMDRTPGYGYYGPGPGYGYYGGYAPAYYGYGAPAYYWGGPYYYGGYGYRSDVPRVRVVKLQAAMATSGTMENDQSLH